MDEQNQRTYPYGPAAIAAGLVLVLYGITMSPTTAFWDASEYIATAHILGIPHPPGNSLFVVFAKTWSLALGVLGIPVAIRINLLAATTSALTAGFWFLLSHRLLSGLKSLTPRMLLVGAGASALLSGTAFTVWNQSNVNEKVYTVSMMIMAAVTWLAVLWYDRRDRPQSLRYLVAAAYLMVLGSTSHLMSMLSGPAIAVLVLFVAPGLLLKRNFWASMVPVMVIALSFNFFLPIRSAQDPIINEGEPSCETMSGAAIAVFTNGKAGCRALAANLSREQYGKPPVTERNAPFGHQLLNYYQYFDWQWARGVDHSEQPGGGRSPFTLLFLALGGAGLYFAFRSDRMLGGYLAVLAGTLTFGLIFYLNFRYGFSLAPEITDLALHEVRERDYFFIVSFSVWGMLAGIGLAGLWGWLSARVGGAPEGGTEPGGRATSGALLSSPVLLVALIPLALNWAWATRSGDYAARDWAFDLLQSVEPYGVLFTNGDNDTFPLWYLQEVEGIRQDVTVVVVQYLFTPWYLGQLQRHTAPDKQRPYDPEQSIYPDVPKPERALVSLSPEDMDRVQATQLPDDLTVGLGPIAVSYPQGTFLNRGQLLALTTIRDSLGQRPVYFASFAGIMAGLGLSDWGVRHGLAVKLLARPPESPLPEGIVPIPERAGTGSVDVDTSLRLVDEVFMSRSLGDRTIWPDRATINIPLQYYIFYAQLTEGLAAMGADGELVERARALSESFLATYQGASS